MAANIDSGSFKIVSRTGGNLPIGVNLTRPAFQFVYLDAPIRFWTFNSVGDAKYKLSINGYPHTGVIENKVVASTDPKDEVIWQVTFHEHHAAYTIALANDPSRGWTLVPESGQVEIQLITAALSEPPQFLPNQLFAFEPFKL